ncbi:MAG: transposase [Cytophagales bacterium]|nr:MAG: transposase [Cytophagales bacterium]
MKLISNQLYHIYNQGNNQETIFLEKDDYLNFLFSARNLLLTHSDILAYCLMPNHFHFLVDVTEKSVQEIKLGGIFVNQLTNAFRLLLSNYAQDFNKKYNRSGSLFRQKTKGKCLKNIEANKNYPLICFHYIHQNPLKAKLVEKMEDWDFSSFKDYAKYRNGTFINKELAFKYLPIYPNSFYDDSYKIIDDDLIDGLLE